MTAPAEECAHATVRPAVVDQTLGVACVDCDDLALLRGTGAALHALGWTKGGEPLHPLMQRGDLQPQVWAP